MFTVNVQNESILTLIHCVQLNIMLTKLNQFQNILLKNEDPELHFQGLSVLADN